MRANTMEQNLFAGAYALACCCAFVFAIVLFTVFPCVNICTRRAVRLRPKKYVRRVVGWAMFY